MITMQIAVANYLQSDEVASKAVNTRKRTRLVLNWVLDTTGKTLPVARFTRAHVDAVLAIKRAEVAASSLNTYKSVLRTFGAWLLATDALRKDPAVHLKPEKTAVDYRKRVPLTPEQTKSLVKISAAQHPRDGMTVILMLTTGLRESEVVGLRWRDADFADQSFLAYRPKTKDWHTSPWSDQLGEFMTAWKERYETCHGPVRGQWFIVPSLAYRSESKVLQMHPDWPLRPEAKQTQTSVRIKRLLRAVGVKDLAGKGSHTLRRTSANALLDSGADVREVMTLLGHSSVTITEAYLSIDTAKAKLRERVKGWEI